MMCFIITSRVERGGKPGNATKSYVETARLLYCRGCVYLCVCVFMFRSVTELSTHQRLLLSFFISLSPHYNIATMNYSYILTHSCQNHRT